jgi:Protein of unknown function (DUF1580)
MIDLAAEKTFALSHASKFLPSARQGKPVSLSCLLRWIFDGVRTPDGSRVRLEALRLGGKWVTSMEALQRFAEAQTPKLDGDPRPLPRMPTGRARAAQRAARDLERAGI